MKKLVYLLPFCVLTANLYAQAGWSADQRLVFMQGDNRGRCLTI